MPSDRAKAVINSRWDRHQKDARGWRQRPDPLSRQEEIEAIERFAAAQGIKRLPPVDMPEATGSRPQTDAGPRPMVGWNK